MKKTIMFLGVLSLGLAQAQQEFEGKVGVNTETPSATLNVKSKTGKTGATKNFELENANGTKMVTVLDNGNVGFNNEAPKDKLHILGNSILENDNSALSLVGTNKQGINFYPTGLANPKAQVGFIKTANSRYSADNINDFTFKNELGNFYFDNSVAIKGPTTILTGQGNGWGRSNEALQLDLVHFNSSHPEGTPEYVADKVGSGATIFTRQFVLGPDSKKGHEILFGLKHPHVWYNPYIAFSTGEVINNKTTGNLIEHMRIDVSGRIGMGTKEPSNVTLHIVPRHLDNRHPAPDPLRLEGLKDTEANKSYKALVVDADGVVKVGSATSTGATQLSGTEGIECNEDNRGKMNFKKGDTDKSDVFGVCLKNTNGSYNWAYLIGGGNLTNGTGTFGSGL